MVLFNVVGLYISGNSSSFNEITGTISIYSKAGASDNVVSSTSNSSSSSKQIEDSNLKNTNENEHILRILDTAKLTSISEEQATQLPTWKDITSMYGDKPVIRGLETCEQYRKMVKPEDRTIKTASKGLTHSLSSLISYGHNSHKSVEKLALAQPYANFVLIGPGLFNTGTNLIWKMMTNNCNIDGEILWQAPWGKHSIASNRLKRVALSGEGINQTEFFPFVMIKDPFSWMNSQCHHGYGVTFWNSDYDEKHCPKLIRENIRDRDETVPMKLFTGGKTHDSLLDAYNYWYGEWEAERLSIRYEDLLFHGKEVSRIACECVGGNVTTEFQYELGSAKGSDGGYEGSNGLLKALVQYGNPATRLSGFTDRDLSYARRNNATAKLMEEYAYSYPAF
eukprot:scaffold9252_cov160-Skeletonema_marinoi.AAC.13